MNRVKQLWREGNPAIGGFLSIPHCLSAEAMAHTGLDWLCIDMQRYIDQGFKMAMLAADRLAMSNYVKAAVGRLTGWTPLVPTQAPNTSGY